MYDVYVIPPSCRPMVILLCECVDFVIAFLGYKTPRRIEAGSPSSNNPSVRCVSCYCKSRSSGNSCGSPYCSHRRLCDTPSIDMKFLICVALAAVAFLSLTEAQDSRRPGHHNSKSHNSKSHNSMSHQNWTVWDEETALNCTKSLATQNAACNKALTKCLRAINTDEENYANCSKVLSTCVSQCPSRTCKYQLTFNNQPAIVNRFCLPDSCILRAFPESDSFAAHTILDSVYKILQRQTPYAPALPTVATSCHGVTGRCDWEECKGARYPPAPGVDHTVPKFEIAANDTYILDYYDLSPVVDTPGDELCGAEVCSAHQECCELTSGTGETFTYGCCPTGTGAVFNATFEPLRKSSYWCAVTLMSEYHECIIEYKHCSEQLQVFSGYSDPYQNKTVKYGGFLPACHRAAECVNKHKTNTCSRDQCTLRTKSSKKIAHQHLFDIKLPFCVPDECMNEADLGVIADIYRRGACVPACRIADQLTENDRLVTLLKAHGFDPNKDVCPVSTVSIECDRGDFFATARGNSDSRQDCATMLNEPTFAWWNTPDPILSSSRLTTWQIAVLIAVAAVIVLFLIYIGVRIIASRRRRRNQEALDYAYDSLNDDVSSTA